MNKILKNILSVLCITCAAAAYGDPVERPNVSKVWESVPAAFFKYDAEKDTMAYEGLPKPTPDESSFLSAKDTDLIQLTRKLHGLELPDGANYEYVEGKLRVRSTKKDIKKIEELLALFRKYETRFNLSLAKGNRISGDFYSNTGGMAFIFVDEQMMNKYLPNKKDRGSKKASRKKKKAAGNKPIETLEELDSHRLFVLVFEDDIKIKNIKKFASQMGVSESICIYEKDLDPLFMDMKGTAPIVLADCYGFEVKTYASIADLLADKSQFVIWFKSKRNKNAREYRQLYR